MASSAPVRVSALLLFGACALTMAWASACGTSEGGLHVRLEGDLVPGSDFDSVRLRVSRQGQLLQEQVILAANIDGLPVSFNVVSGPLTPSGTTVELEAKAHRAEQLVAQAQGSGMLASGAGATVVLTLSPRLEDGGTPVLDSGTPSTDGGGGGNSDSGVTVDSGTPDAGDPTAPSAPTGLTASNLTARTVRLNWNASTDNVMVTGYEVQQSDGGAGCALTTQLNCTVSELTPATSYQFVVRAQDTAGNASSPSNVASAVTLGQDFILGVNFNGDAVTIEGNLWRSYTAALTQGLSVTNASLYSSSHTPTPATDSATGVMLNTAIFRSDPPLQLSQTLPNGTYRVYFWVMENFMSNYRTLSFAIEGTTVASNVAQMPLAQWQKFGPYSVSVTDGALNVSVDAGGTSGDPHIMGMAVFQ